MCHKEKENIIKKLILKFKDSNLQYKDPYSFTLSVFVNVLRKMCI